MGVLGELAAPAAEWYSSASTLKQASVGFTAFFVVVVVLNVLRQLLLRDPNKPPVVFHYVPFIGSTVTYGMDPFKFFFSNRQKVRLSRRLVWYRPLALANRNKLCVVRRRLYLHPAWQAHHRLPWHQGQ